MVSDPLFAMVQRALAGIYSLEREIGRGGMGVVYLAREVELGRLVALKVLPPEVAAEPGTRERFLREARTAAGLSHPSIVPIYRVGEAGDVVYFSMMFVDGGTLGERLRTRGPLAPSAAMRMLREVSQALAYAHGRGIVHRDIKPDNILLERDSGRALVTDFGIAGSVVGDPTNDDPVMGTIHFMSPEQAAGQRADARSDLYSLGVVAHVALSGRLPERAALVARDAAHEPATQSLAVASPSTPRHLVLAIDRLLAREPDARFATAEAFADAVDSAMVARPALPTPIRSWLAARDPWQTPYLLWTAGWLISAMYEMMGHPDQMFLSFALVIAFVPIIPATLFELRTVRRLLSAGYSLDDVDAALPAWEAEENDEISARDEGRPRWFAPVARTIAWSAIGLAWVVATRAVPGISDLGAMLALFAAALALPLLTALGVPVLPAIAMADKPLRRHFWDSALGRSIERLLQGGRRTLAPANAFRPTELVVGSAVDALWRALPAAYRDHLDDVPDVVKRLEAHASRARAVLVRLDEGSANAPLTGSLATLREHARGELESAVTALESLRLDLLRLLGGDADLAPTTTVLDAARRVDADLSRLREAQREVERVVRPIGLDLRPHTPA